MKQGEATYSLNLEPVVPEIVEGSLQAVGGEHAPYTLLHKELLPEDEQEMLKVVVPKEYHEYINIFTWKDAKAVPPHQEYDHTIEIKNDGQLPYGPIYPLSGVELKALRDHLKDMLGKGFIRASQSPGGACRIRANDISNSRWKSGL